MVFGSSMRYAVFHPVSLRQFSLNSAQTTSSATTFSTIIWIADFFGWYVTFQCLWDFEQVLFGKQASEVRCGAVCFQLSVDILAFWMATGCHIVEHKLIKAKAYYHVEASQQRTRRQSFRNLGRMFEIQPRSREHPDYAQFAPTTRTSPTQRKLPSKDD